MKKNIAMVIGIIAIAVLVFLGSPDEKTKTNEAVNNVQVVQNETPEEVKNETPKSESQVSKQPATKAVITTTVGSYEAYSSEKIARAATGDVVLFFHAPWCPSCRALNKDIEKNVSTIPAGVTILKTDYDSETELKKKYGVTTQHTLVQIDAFGNQIKKWSGGSKLENLLSQIQ